MSKKKKKGTKSKSSMIKKMAGKYNSRVAGDVSLKGKTVDYSSRISLANANSYASSQGKSSFIYNGKVYNTSNARGGSPTQTRSLTV